MKVHEVMTSGVVRCPPDANLAEVAELMWKADCGIVPVVNARDEVVGVITDRDIAIALGTRGQRAADVRVADAMTTNVVTCAPEDRLDDALDLMRRHRVRRLPVVGIGGVLLGLLSLNDVLVQTPQAPSRDPVVATLRAVSAHRQSLVAAG